ncbi:NAD-dependent epimerase/dehydratase family protein [Streptomyces sp. NPDC000345]|uniref:NAD-dependent epimerase/dehydratase family protein n=1 Tax=Streptomyces sp. NPDC000345 TaxID=3364537 RepID=UPI0036C3ED33
MRVLVTGGAGFIGRRTVAELVRLGHEVRVLDALLPEAHPEPVPPRLPGVTRFVHADLRDEAAVRRALDGVGLVVHLAAVVGRGREILDAPKHVGCNNLATAVLLAAMTEAGVSRMVLASSVALYGESGYVCPRHGRVRAPARSRSDLDAGRFDPRCPHCGAGVRAEPVTEDDPVDPPRNVYAVTKLAQEYLVAAWAREAAGRVAALRYHHVYGPEMPYDSPYAGVAAAFRSAVARGEAPEVYEDGASQRDFVHVRDVAAANAAAARWAGAERAEGLRVFNIASGEPRSVGELAAAVAAAGGAPPPVVTGRYRIGDARHIVASPARARRELDWRPRVPFPSGVREFVSAPMRGAAP